MASIFGHALVGLTLGEVMLEKEAKALLVTGIIFTMLPDADVIGFVNGVAYDSPWGHRGFSHSISFAFLMALLASFFFKLQQWRSFAFLFSCMVTHGMLDGMTSGGMGVAYFWPVVDTRYFLPWRPIKVSPLGVGRFFSERGFQVLKSEAMVIGIPCMLILGIQWILKSRKHGNS